MKENLQTEFLTRQYMISQDFEIYYYHDKTLPPPVNLHRHNYYELYFFWMEMYRCRLRIRITRSNPVLSF